VDLPRDAVARTILVDTSVWVDHLRHHDASLWTRDRRLQAVASSLGLS
jgi:predicted nucleic acid-binding protein